MKRARTGITLQGPAHLCYIPAFSNAAHEDSAAGDEDVEGQSAFQGHLVDKATRACYGLMGTQIERKNPLDCCCQADDPPLWFKVTIIDFQSQKETQRIVEKTGGDYVHLSSSQMLFRTNSLKTGAQAEQHMRKYNPKLLPYTDALVCIGDMTVTELDFDDDGCDDGDDLVCSHHHHDDSSLLPDKRQNTAARELDHQSNHPHSHQTNKYTFENADSTTLSQHTNQNGPGNHASHTKNTINDTHSNKNDNNSHQGDDDDFGFEEFKNVPLIKVGEKHEEILAVYEDN